MIYLLDTNTCVRFMNGHAPSVRSRLLSIRPDTVRVCSIVKMELAFGAGKSQRVAENLESQRLFLHPYQSLPFDDEAALICGDLRSNRARHGTPIGPYDLQIAAIALIHGLTLVTHNTVEFARVRGLKLEDWEA